LSTADGFITLTVAYSLSFHVRLYVYITHVRWLHRSNVAQLYTYG